MQNKKNKKQNGGEAEGQIIFTYVLLTFLVGFIGYCIYWCFSSGPENCKQFFKNLDEGKWADAWSIFLDRDEGFIEQGFNKGAKVVKEGYKYLQGNI